MLGLISFKNIRFFPIIVLLGFYLIQSIAGLLIFSGEEAPRHFLTILGTSIFGYIIGAYLLLDPAFVNKIINRKNRIKLNINVITFLIFGLYFLMVAFVAITAKEIALFSAIKGASIADLANQREEFIRTRTGWQSILRYMFVMFNSAIIPYWIVLLFSIKHRIRFIILSAFLFVLLLTLEKSLSLLALLPLAVYYLNTKSKKQALQIVFMLICFIGLASFLSRGGASSGANQPEQLIVDVEPNQYNIFNNNLQTLYVINRVVWVPYITAIDWLRYQHEVMHDKFTMGRSIGIVSLITGREYIAIEREVFAFEYGQNVTGTGNANTAFFLDGFINWGYLGSLFYSIILGIIVRLFSLTDNIACKCVSYIPFFNLGGSSLTATMFSGGLFILLLILLYIKPPQIERAGRITNII